MTSWTPQSKNTSSFTNQVRNTGTFTNQTKTTQVSAGQPIAAGFFMFLTYSVATLNSWANQNKS